MVKKKLTPLQAVKHYCRYQCCANDTISWKECTAEGVCPLFPYRMGKRPKKQPFTDYCEKKPIVLTIKLDKKEHCRKEMGVENE